MIHPLRARLLALVTAGGLAAIAAGAAPEPPPPLPDSKSAAEILLSIEKLNVLGRVLYVAAHPDDENTALISFWANGALYDAAYLSITRGDGGQNLIGPELRESLGVIRTNELLAARRIDHGRQFFTRAIDFGFSKNPEESLRFWDHDKMLADVVWVIRRFQPDVIVTRFQPEDRNTHGHHSASAMLAVEAFRAAADPKKFPDQLAYVKPWQAKRVVWNTSSFFYTARNLPFDTTGLTAAEVGGFNALLGKSYMEIAAASRSMHKSQGFGVPVNRGSRKDYFKPLEGEPMTGDLFDGVDTTWARVPGAGAVAAKVREVMAAFRAADPAASVPGLLQVRQALAALPPGTWVNEKRNQVDQVIAASLGLHAESVASKPSVSPGQNLSVQVEAINPSNVEVKLRALTFPATGETIAVDAPLAANQLFKKTFTPKLPETLPFSQPYWLRQPGTTGTFSVSDQTLIGLPENPPAFPVNLTLEIGGQELQFAIDTQHRSVDPVQGEVHQALVIAPPVFANFAHPVFVFGDDKSKSIQVRVVANADCHQGTAQPRGPDRMAHRTGGRSGGAEEIRRRAGGEFQGDAARGVERGLAARGRDHRRQALRIFAPADQLSAHRPADAHAAGRVEAGARRHPPEGRPDRFSAGGGR